MPYLLIRTGVTGGITFRITINNLMLQQRPFRLQHQCNNNNLNVNKINTNNNRLCTLAPPVGRLPEGYDANARCNFHSGAPGHTIENCKAFKHVVHDLIDSRAINFASAPNVVNNPIP
ncbi:hypothetical protein KIW84_052437 [Lathyrus oleraceus]|uniref:Uncharacterized protein n=1 Tax=Pisum sativum TaxID=3888 RepID=A0A9D4WNP5_PEA|nr:hypothetical protein KIW84_052437 [Pisum sativum]